MNQAAEYEKDFYAWAAHNAELLRQGNFSELDTENIAEELEAMSRSEKRELINRLAVLLRHLLKWHYQPDKRSHSWEYTIIEQVQQVLEDSPSLSREFEEKLKRAYDLAVLSAARETGLSRNAFPVACPYTFDQIFNENFYPG